MPRDFQVVDLFAGPGGLAEGFSACRREDGTRPFHVAMSVEKERSAHRTLRLRAFLRQFEDGFPPEYYEALNARADLPDWAELYPREWRAAEAEALCLEMGLPAANAIIASRVDSIRMASGGNTILIGGPPCQAYSLVGRARNRGNAGYRAEEDGRHFLYREYISVLKRLQPAAFVMENVKGILSSSIEGQLVFEKILDDLRNCGGPRNYILIPIAASEDDQLDPVETARPADFIVRAEQFGIPQARHRVIIVGVRSDVYINGETRERLRLISRPTQAFARHVLVGMPPLRSGLSGADDGLAEWRRTVREAIAQVIKAISEQRGSRSPLANKARELSRHFDQGSRTLDRTNDQIPAIAKDCPKELGKWLLDRRLKIAINHESRTHMSGDLGRYFYCALFTAETGRSPKAGDFPERLAPKHANWTSGKFADRFRAQNYDAPSTTVTSHISKDGHYFIHPDPIQCRSLTVREAARLQTFPDNYLFLGNRTQQYVQVGNAVPPLLAHAIAQQVLAALAVATGATRSKRSLTRSAA